MTPQLTSSAVVVSALGFEPDGVPAEKAGNCAFCGAEIKVGDPNVPFSVTGAFMDDLSLAARGSDMTCGHCVHVLSADGLRATSHGVFSKAGVQPFRKWADVAKAVTEPPEAPFVMVYATANNQHMAWRAPVNYSRDLFYVRVGLRDLKIRRQKLLDAVKVCERVGLKMGRTSDPSRKTLVNPFAALSSDLKEVSHADLTGAINLQYSTKFEHLQADQEYQDDLRFLMDLSLGESWALRFVLTPNAGQASE